MRLIITGGTGLIGKHFAKLMKDQGYEVIILSRNPQKYDLWAGIKLHKWDAKTGDGWSHLIHRDTAIINLAGENPAADRWTDEHKERVLQSRLYTADAVCDAIKQAPEKPATLLQASAVGYYGDMGDTTLTEDSPAGDNWRAQVVVDWEQAAQPIANMGIRTCWLRIGIVLDAASGALPAFVQAAKMMGKQIGDGQQYIPWVHNDEIAHQMRYLLLKESTSGVYNLCAPQPATNEQLMQATAQALHRPAIVPVPAFALKFVLGEMATTVLDSQRVIPQRLIDAGYEFKHPDLQATLCNLL